MYSQQDYFRDLKQLEQQFEKDKEVLETRLVNAKIAINNEFLASHHYKEGTTFNEFVDAMKQKLRIVIIFENHDILVLNDPTIRNSTSHWGSGMLGFQKTENQLHWWEHTPAAFQQNYSFYYEDGNLYFQNYCDKKCARWFLSTDVDILRNSPICIQKIEYPVK